MRKAVFRIYDGSEINACEIALEMAHQGYYLAWGQGTTLCFYPLEGKDA